MLSLKDDVCFPNVKIRSHELRFDRNYSGCAIVECASKYRGYKESTAINEWLSQIFEEPVFIMRAETDRAMTCSDYLDK